MLGIVIALYTTSIITGILRFYTHGVIIKRFFAEDYLTLIALVKEPGLHSRHHCQSMIVRAVTKMKIAIKIKIKQSILTFDDSNSSYLPHIRSLGFLQSPTA